MDYQTLGLCTVMVSNNEMENAIMRIDVTVQYSIQLISQICRREQSHIVQIYKYVAHEWKWAFKLVQVNMKCQNHSVESL